MGTRGLTQVNMNNKIVVAQYGQWDHYPSGQGITILEFLRARKGKFERFKKKLERVRFIRPQDQKEIDVFSKKIGIKDGWMNMEQAEKYHKRFPYFNRDHGGKILELINKSTKKDDVLLVDSHEFLSDGLFCEGGYVIDFDKNTFSVYLGGAEPTKVYQLDDLPTNKQFLSDLEPDDED